MAYLEEIVAHEVGHALGIPEDKQRTRKEDDVMYEERGLASDAYLKSRWKDSDLSAVAERFSRMK
jgi:hypothetical protein